MAGVTYQRLAATISNQALQSQQYMRSRYSRGADLLVAVNAVMDELKFEPETAPEFERAMAAIGELIGFETQRPESEYGRGPDVLWKMGGLLFAVIECKNGAIVEQVGKRDCDQLSGSVNWFHEEYDNSCTCQPIMVHPSATAAHDGTHADGARVVTPEKLRQFKDAIRGYAVACAAKPQFGVEVEVSALLVHFGLTGPEIFQRYAVAAR